MGYFSDLGAQIDAALGALEKRIADLEAQIKALKDNLGSPTTTTTTTSPPSATTTTTTTAAPTGGGLPQNVVSEWHHCWKGPLPWGEYPSGVKSQVNFISLGIAQSAAAGTGRLSYYNRFGGGLKPAIMAAHAAGARVIMGIGGASDGGITITNDTQITEAFNSMVSFVDQFGISGMDIDLEPSGSGWNEASLVRLADKLLAKYPNFIIGITPGLYGTHTARWMSLGRAMGNRYKFMAPMLYDFPEAGDGRLTAVALDKCRIMKAGGVPEDKMILGFMTRWGVYPNSTPGAQLCIDAYKACKKAYPGLRGAFHWEDDIDRKNNWAWALNIGPVIRGS